MLYKMSLIASALGLTVVGTSVEPVTPLHIVQLDISAAYEFNSIDECRSKLHALYADNMQLKNKLTCKPSNDG